MENQKNKKKLRNKIISSLATTILVITVCFCVYVIIQVLGKGYVFLGSHSFFRVITPSMEPNLSVGEVIVTKAVPIETVQVGDIISFRSQSADMFGTIITHRVIEIKRDENGHRCLLTKGDANLALDGRYVLESNFLGKVVWSSGDSFISSLFSFISGKYGFTACIVFPSILVLSFIISETIKSIKQDMEKLIETADQHTGSELFKVNEIELAQPDYDEMYQRIREELLEELKNSEDSQNFKTE